MEYGFFHAERGYWQATSEVPQSTRDGYPEGTVEVPLKPSAGYEWDGAAWVDTRDPAAELAAWRESRYVPIEQFFNSAVTAGLVTDDEADAAVMHGTWPGSFNQYIAHLTRAEQRTIKGEMARVRTIWRMHPTVLSIAAAQIPPIPPEGIDALFQ